MLKRREECDTYLTQVCRHQHSIEKIKELSVNTMAFISCRSRLYNSWWKSQCWLKAPLCFHQVFHAIQIYRPESGRCHTLPFFLTFYVFWLTLCKCKKFFIFCVLYLMSPSPKGLFIFSVRVIHYYFYFQCV